MQQDEHVVTLIYPFHLIRPRELLELQLELSSHSPSSLVVRAAVQVEAAAMLQWREVDRLLYQPLGQLSLEIRNLHTAITQQSYSNQTAII